MILDVPYSNPPIRLTFDEYELRPDRNETDAEQCFKQAILECFDPRKHSIEFEVGVRQRWGSGEMRLYLTPEGKPSHPSIGLKIKSFKKQQRQDFDMFQPKYSNKLGPPPSPTILRREEAKYMTRNRSRKLTGSDASTLDLRKVHRCLTGSQQLSTLLPSSGLLFRDLPTSARNR